MKFIISVTMISSAPRHNLSRIASMAHRAPNAMAATKRERDVQRRNDLAHHGAGEHGADRPELKLTFTAQVEHATAHGDDCAERDQQARRCEYQRIGEAPD